MANYPFPNQKLELGSTGRFVTDLQRELGIAVTGVFDFLTMCKVALHKFEHGLNHNDPTVDAETWNTVFKNNDNDTAPDTAERAAAPAAPGDRTGIASVGQIPRTNNNDNEGNPRATTNGTTIATDENIPAPAQPDTNPDAPREDQPTVTANEQQATGGPAGGYTATPTETAVNTPSPAEQAAGAESADNGPGTATP